jgi:hypothetical protein
MPMEGEVEIIGLGDAIGDLSGSTQPSVVAVL